MSVVKRSLMDVVPRTSKYSLFCCSSLTIKNRGFRRALRPSCSRTDSSGRPRSSRADIMLPTFRKRVTMQSCIALLISLSSSCKHNPLSTIASQGQPRFHSLNALYCMIYQCNVMASTRQECCVQRFESEQTTNQPVFSFCYWHGIHVQKLSLNLGFCCFRSITSSQVGEPHEQVTCSPLAERLLIAVSALLKAYVSVRTHGDTRTRRNEE